MIENLLKNIKDDHSVSVKEGRLLSKLAKECDGVIVEIGSWKGYSTIRLAKGSQEGNCVKVYAIDPHTGSDFHKQMYGKINTFDKFLENITLAGVRDIVIPLKMKSEIAVKNWDTPIALLWIDGDHKIADKDLDMWYQYVKYGGIVALHDTTTWEIPKKVAMSIYKSGNYTDIKRVMSITYARKVNILPRINKIENLYAFYKRYIDQFFIPYYIKCLILADRVIRKVRGVK